MKKINQIALSAGESLELMLAPNGFKLHRIYGNVAIREVLTEKTIKEAVYVTLRHFRQVKIATIEFMSGYKKQVEFDMAELLIKSRWYTFRKNRKIKELSRIRELLTEMITQYGYEAPKVSAQQYIEDKFTGDTLRL